MKEPLNIQLANRDQFMTREAGTVEGVWLKLPATAEQLNTALARIGLQGGELNKDYFINGVETPIPAIERIPLEKMQETGINELNYLAAQLETLDDKQIAKLNVTAVLTSDSGNVHLLAEQARNTNFYEQYPDIMNHAQLGEHIFNKSGLIQIPEYWAEAIDREKLGQLAAEHETGIFTEYGYIVKSGAEWEPLTEIPQEYQITPKTERPQRESKQPDTPTVEHEATAPGATIAEPPTQTKGLAVAAPFVLVSDNPKDKLTEITGRLEDGVRNIFESEQYKKCLDTFSKFHNYSVNNCLLIAMQKPDATHVGGFNFWKDEMKRPVMKGEKGIKIIAPAPFKTTKTVDKLDTNGNPIVGKDGKRVKEEQEITIPAFKVTSVFDVSQTDGEPLPELGVSELVGSVDKYKEFYTALEKASPVPISFEAIGSGAKGYYHQTEKRIVINEGMSELQNLKTAIHEMAHAKLHAIDTEKPLKVQDIPDRDTREIQAESIAYTVCQHYGLDTSDYSFGYVAGWSGEKELDTLKTSLDTIRKEAGAIITEVDKHFAELTQDKERTAEIPTTEQGNTFTIYQLKDSNETREIRFEPLDRLQQPPDLANYEKIYAAPLDNGITLEKIYADFNIDRPKDFTGHSLSVSDVVVVNRDGKESAFYVDSVGFKELPNFLTPQEQIQDKPTPTIDLKAVADYMQKLNDGLQAVKPDSSMSVGAYNAVTKRLEQSNERIPAEHTQLKDLITNAVQSPDFNTLKERMNTLHTEFTQHYSTAVQNTIDTSGKAEPPAPTASVRQTDTPPVKPPARGENVAAIEARVKAGEVINLTDLSDAIKKDKQAAQSKTTPQAQTKSATWTTAKKQDWKGTQRQDARDRAQSKAAAKPTQEKPSIKDKIAAGRREIAGQKSAIQKTVTKNKNAGLGE
jgi:antirestriction protein ArdC